MEARSMDNGIYFRSQIYDDYIAIVTIDKNSNITQKWTTETDFLKGDKDSQKRSIIFLLSLLGPALLFFYLVFPVMYNGSINSKLRSICFWSILMFLTAFIISNIIDRICQKDSFKFHAAEHMAINAYQTLNRVPSLQEISQFSRFRNSCGTNITIQLIMIFIVIFILTFIPSLICKLIFFISGCNGIEILRKHGFLNLPQYFTTSVPTNRELLVAIIALEFFLKNEKSK